MGQQDERIKGKPTKNNPSCYKELFKKPNIKFTKIRKLTWFEKLTLLICAIFLLQQLLTPIRHNFYEGTTAWNEYGHKFSWRMKLRTKKCNPFFFTYNSEIDNAEFVPSERILNRKQMRKVGSRPQLIIQYAKWLRDYYDTNLYPSSNSTTEV